MPPSIRRAVRSDLPGIVALLTEGARGRQALDPLLWRLAADAPARIEAAVDTALGGSAAPSRELWLVAADRDRIVGVAHAMLLPVPPIYDESAGLPGLLLDDCLISADAPSGTADSLVAASEAALKAAGAASLIASCPANSPLRPIYEQHGYQPVTLYMARHHLSAGANASGVRPATADDVPAIVKLSAQHRRTLAVVNPRFWHIHPDADTRFERWMQHSLTLKDRDMFVAANTSGVHGYVIDQPASPLLVPAPHEITGIGVIDDFYDASFADVAVTSGSGGADLLAAAESAFARRSVSSALVVCPAAWTSKVSLLERAGYRTAKLWMLKN